MQIPDKGKQIYNVVANDSRDVHIVYKVRAKSAKHAMERFDAEKPKHRSDFEAYDAYPCKEADPKADIV